MSDDRKQRRKDAKMLRDAADAVEAGTMHLANWETKRPSQIFPSWDNRSLECCVTTALVTTFTLTHEITAPPKKKRAIRKRGDR